MSKNKTVVFLGSSVTYGVDGWSMCEFLRETEEYNVVKWAVSGTTLCDIEDISYISRLNKEIGAQDDCDLFICQLSTNDAAKDLPLGEIGSSFDINDFDTQTVAGAIQYIIATAKQRWNCPIMFYTGTYFESKNYYKMVDLLLEISKKWDIGLIDLWNDAEMRAISPKDYAEYMRNPSHPSKEGYRKWWGPKFAQAINGIFEDK